MERFPLRTPSDGSETISEDRVRQRKVLRLDHRNLYCIEPLHAFTHIRELYLQHNCIRKIENLDGLTHLLLLSLAENQIEKIENLRTLKELRYLNLSKNRIEDFEMSDIPSSVQVLRIDSNPFQRHMPQYASLFFARLPHLRELDRFTKGDEGQIVTNAAPSIEEFLDAALNDKDRKRLLRDTEKGNLDDNKSLWKMQANSLEAQLKKMEKRLENQCNVLHEEGLCKRMSEAMERAQERAYRREALKDDDANQI